MRERDRIIRGVIFMTFFGIGRNSPLSQPLPLLTSFMVWYFLSWWLVSVFLTREIRL
jgi:hypothetical protein